MCSYPDSVMLFPDILCGFFSSAVSRFVKVHTSAELRKAHANITPTVKKFCAKLLQEANFVATQSKRRETIKTAGSVDSLPQNWRN